MRGICKDSEVRNESEKFMRDRAISLSLDGIQRTRPIFAEPIRSLIARTPVRTFPTHAEPAHEKLFL